MSSFFFLYLLSLYSTSTLIHLMSCQVLLYGSAKISLTPEAFPGPLTLGQGDLLCAPIAPYISNIRNPDVQFCNYLLTIPLPPSCHESRAYFFLIHGPYISLVLTQTLLSVLLNKYTTYIGKDSEVSYIVSTSSTSKHVPPYSHSASPLTLFS